MTTSLDKAGLPPMISRDDVVQAQQQTDLKDFRKYLIQSGTIKSLVKLYQHTLKNEVRMDNPNLVSEFMNKYRDDTDPQVEEQEQLVAENTQLRDTNIALAQQFTNLEVELKSFKQRSRCKALWGALTSSQFWTAQSMDEETAAALKTDGFSGAQLFARLCGSSHDAGTGSVLVELVRPAGLSAETKIDPESFISWMMEEAPQDVVDWCQTELIPKLKESADPPFEKLLVSNIQESGLLPTHIEEVANIVTLEPGLGDFLESIVTRFADASA